MASIAWLGGYPASQAPNGIIGECSYSIGVNEKYDHAEMVANVPGRHPARPQGPEYSTPMTKDKPMAGQLYATLLNLPPGTYDVLGKLWYNDASGMHGIQTTVGQVKV